MANKDALRASFGGKSIVGSRTIQINLTQGTRPVMIDIDLLPADAKALRDFTGPYTLEVECGSKTSRFKDWYILHDIPAEYKEISRFIIADRRWLWDRKLIIRSYNMHRRVGGKSLPNPSQQPELRQVEAVVEYHPWSLNPKTSKPWTIREILTDITDEITEYEASFSGAGVKFAIELDPIDESRFPIENLELNDNAGDALARVLGIIPEAGVTVLADGTPVIFNRPSNYENDLAKAVSGREIYGTGLLQTCDLRLVRPKEIHVFFEREVEVRLDAMELGPTVTTARDPEGRWMENVLPNPDWTLNTSPPIPQGVWVEFGQALGAFGTVSGLRRPLELRDIQICMVPFIDFWSTVELNGNREPNRDWGSRISAIQRHYRRTWRINEKWKSKVRAIKPYRIGTINTTTGTRAPALCYSDYCRVGSQRSKLKNFDNGLDDGALFMNYSVSDGVEWKVTDKITDKFHPAPATVNVIDQDQGIIDINYLNDIYKVHDITLPSMIELDGSNTKPGVYPKTAASANLTGRETSIGFNVLFENMKLPKLTTEYHAAVILTVSPAAPNDSKRLQKVVVKPEEIIPLLPAYMIPDLVSNSKGPILEIYVGANVAQALVAWVEDDTCPSIIDALLNAKFSTDVSQTMENYIVNMGDANNARAPGIRGVSYVYAAAAWAMYANRVIGQTKIRMDHGVVPKGRTI